MTMPQEHVTQQPTTPPAAPPKERNVLGLVALIVAIVGFIFACIPGALIIGWILLPIAFILSIVSFFMKGKGKGMGITALILSVVGTIVGVVVFLAAVASSFDEAFSTGETTVETPAQTSSDTGDADEAAPAEDQGTRANPYPIGTAITQGDWTVTINSVTLDANEAIAAENPYNDPPADGNVYILVNLTATYNGTDADGQSPLIGLDYVTPDGNTINSFDSIVLTPDTFDIMGTLYEGASTTGNISFEVPAATAGEGVLAVTPHMFGDKVFVAVS